MRFAYADPPYPGCAHYYAQDPNAPEGGAREVNHRLLVGWLCDEFPDGWALSTHANALRDVIALCPPDVRIAAWVKPFATWTLGGRGGVPFAWEPVIWRTARGRETERPTRLGVHGRDWMAVSPPMRQRVPGEKPHAFGFWIFQLLGAFPGDEIVDVFPGSGAIGEAWVKWCQAGTTESLPLFEREDAA